MGKSVTNENLVKLRELSDELCSVHKDDYLAVVKKLKKIIDDGKEEIDLTNNSISKIKCYETMCASITNILNTVKI
jgi:acetoin utilization deacetylase AcuC-like enzyme